NIASTFPSSCDGSASCACSANACNSNNCASSCGSYTDPFVRIGYFYTNATNDPGYACAENAAAGYGDPFSVMAGWLQESCAGCSSTTCGSNPDTHRLNILN